MARPRLPSNLDDATVDAAIEAMSADELRETIRVLLAWLDDTTHARLAGELVDRAARNATGWAPEAPDERDVGAIEAFAAAAALVGRADPSEVDGYLTEGSNAFLARDYTSACRIFRALLVPIGEAEIDLGQDEMVDEVLGVDVATCAVQYVVARYMTASPSARGEAVLSALDDMDSVHYAMEPLRELERVAVEPLPGFDAFLVQWRALVEQRAGAERNSEWDRREDRWLREVVARQEGARGLARVARISRRADDLRAWCRALVEARDWRSALEAHEEAATLVVDSSHARGEFLDGVALAAQELGGDDLDARLEAAWRGVPSVLRLRRWLGTAATAELLRERAATALGACPPGAARQRALLHLLGGEIEPAATLLAAAPGLGWSDDEHPGTLVFPAFMRILGDNRFPFDVPNRLEELELATRRDEPRLSAPSIEELLVGVGLPTPAPSTREAMIQAMRSAAEKRIEGVTEHQRRRHYEHAAALAVSCARVDGASGEAWLADLQDRFRRYPALKRAFGAARR